MYFTTRKITGEKVHSRKELPPSEDAGGRERSARRDGSGGGTSGSISTSGPGKETQVGFQGGDDERVRALGAQRPPTRQWVAQLWERSSGVRWRAPPEEQRKEG